MEITSLNRSETLTEIELSGKLDTAAVDRIETRFNAFVVAPGKSAVIDLSEVTLITSMGIRMLVTAARSLAARGRKLVLLGPRGVVDDALRAADLYAVMPMARTPEEAERLCLNRTDP
jgi:anti-anti-sigma factor